MYHDPNYPSEKEVDIAMAPLRARLAAEEPYVPSALELRMEAETREALRHIAQKHVPHLVAGHSGMSRLIKVAACTFCDDLQGMEYRYRKGYGSGVMKRGRPKNRTRRSGRNS